MQLSKYFKKFIKRKDIIYLIKLFFYCHKCQVWHFMWFLLIWGLLVAVIPGSHHSFLFRLVEERAFWFYMSKLLAFKAYNCFFIFFWFLKFLNFLHSLDFSKNFLNFLATIPISLNSLFSSFSVLEAFRVMFFF